MKMLFNNHVHGNQLATVDNNVYHVVSSDISLYGLCPKFELSHPYSIVVEYLPKDGLWAWFFSVMSYFSPDKKIEAHTSGDSAASWVSLFPRRYTLGWRIRGCRIRKERTDCFTVNYTTMVGPDKMTYVYDVCITASIDDPVRFYGYLKNNGSDLWAEINNLLQDAISKEFSMRGYASFLLHTGLSSKVLEDAGYVVKCCRIQYNK